MSGSSESIAESQSCSVSPARYCSKLLIREKTLAKNPSARKLSGRIPGRTALPKRSATY
jgi:hypothetical protein